MKLTDIGLFLGRWISGRFFLDLDRLMYQSTSIQNYLYAASVTRVVSTVLWDEVFTETA